MTFLRHLDDDDDDDDEEEEEEEEEQEEEEDQERMFRSIKETEPISSSPVCTGRM